MDVNKRQKLLFLEDKIVVVHYCILNLDWKVIDTTNQPILMMKRSNEHVDNVTSPSNKNFKSSGSDIANATNVNNNSPTTAVTTDTEMTSFILMSWYLLIDKHYITNIIWYRW